MYKEVLQSIEGIGIYPIISLLFFFVFFVGILVWYFRADKAYLKKMAELPLDNSDKLQQFQSVSGEV